ncbi:MAG: spore cortex biosynthesis protein YabQ [Clostridia bacterium]|nr:spore cortex biosynthesis protein YabQ [Clostridia bacterium]
MKWDIRVLAYSVMCGVLMGLIYEVFRILRVTLFPSSAKLQKFRAKQLPRTSEEAAIVLRGENQGRFSASEMLTAVCDVIFGIISGACTAVLVFHTNNGEIRWFALTGCALGFSAYMLTFGKLAVGLYLKTKSIVLKIVKKVLAILLSPIIIPLKAIAKRLKKRIIKKKAKRMLLNTLKEMKKKDERDTSEDHNGEG